MQGVLSEIISLLTSGITSIGTAIGGGLSNLAQNIFLDTTGNSPTLSTFGGLVIVFAGVAFAIGLSRFVLNWLTSLGN